MRANLAVALAMTFAAACGHDESVPLPAWQLRIDGEAERAVHLPARLELPHHDASYVLTVRVPLPPGYAGRELALTIASLKAIAELRVDGVRVPSATARPGDRFRRAGPQRWVIPPEATTGRDALDLELTVLHRWDTDRVLFEPPRLAYNRYGDAQFRAVTAWNDWMSMAPGAIVFMGVIYAAVYLLDRRRKSYVLFALQAIFAVPWAFMDDGGWQFLGPANYTVVAGLFAFASAAAVAFVYAELSLGPAPRVTWWGLVATIAGLAALFDRFDLRPSTAIASTYVFGCGALLLWQLGRRLLRGGDRLRPALYFAAISSISVCGIASVVYYLGLADVTSGAYTVTPGLLVYAFLQALALAWEHMRSLASAELLNVELRRQIASRSRQLVDAFDQLASKGGTPPPLAVGDVVEDRYLVRGRLGEGAMGAVYEVERRSDGRRLALKMMSRPANASALARFAREAQIAAQLDHPNLVAIVDVDLGRSTGLFLVLELVEGQTLEAARARFGDPAWARPVLAQVATGLAAMHERGVVHRDLKPANVLLTGRGVAKIADFGLAALAGDTPAAAADSALGDTMAAPDPSLTQTGMVMGTPLYMAPELVRGAREATPPADMYSFGTLAYELISGRLPLSDSEVRDRLHGGSGGAVPRCANAGDGLATLLERCLDLDPARRPSAAELARALT